MNRKKIAVGSIFLSVLFGFMCALALLGLMINLLLGSSKSEVECLADDGNYFIYKPVTVQKDEIEGEIFYVIQTKHEGYDVEVGFFSDENEKIATENGFYEDCGSKEITCVFCPFIFGDGDVGKIAALYSEDKVYLSYEKGKENLVKEFEYYLAYTEKQLTIHGVMAAVFAALGILFLIRFIKSVKNRRNWRKEQAECR